MEPRKRAEMAREVADRDRFDRRRCGTGTGRSLSRLCRINEELRSRPRAGLLGVRQAVEAGLIGTWWASEPARRLRGGVQRPPGSALSLTLTLRISSSDGTGTATANRDNASRKSTNVSCRGESREEAGGMGRRERGVWGRGPGPLAWHGLSAICQRATGDAIPVYPVERCTSRGRPTGGLWRLGPRLARLSASEEQELRKLQHYCRASCPYRQRRCRDREGRGGKRETPARCPPIEGPHPRLSPTRFDGGESRYLREPGAALDLVADGHACSIEGYLRLPEGHPEHVLVVSDDACIAH